MYSRINCIIEVAVSLTTASKYALVSKLNSTVSSDNVLPPS
ncbi:11961_t:CDS:2 [Dentiscutata erythropus]|uniref:11961_t:CDS:1 n=1 Tax=Dentiscutata erythropus TaxID=1348616 RepID=A0A9N8VEZ0_9GLOM|nr:11961_t:CDS:2 [Dentiscutata erythropus]